MTRILIFVMGLTLVRASPIANANRGFFSKSLTEEAADLIDKIPSVELKVGSDGFAVSTGPSNNDLYFMLALIIGSIAVFVVIMALFVWCCFCSNLSPLNPRTNSVVYGSKLQNINPLMLASNRLNEAKIQVGIHL